MYSLAFYKKEFATNWKLAFPVILGMLGHTFVAFADNIMVGQLGAAELAAVSLGNSFFFVAFAVGIGISAAITPLIAEADGSGKKLNVKKVFKHGLSDLFELWDYFIRCFIGFGSFNGKHETTSRGSCPCGTIL